MEDVPDGLVVQESHKVLKNAAQVLVEDHSQSKARLVDIFVQTLTNAHENDLDHLLEFFSRHLNLVKQSLWPDHFVSNNRQLSRWMSELVCLFKAAILNCASSLTLSIVSLRH